jgi:hypothetical protein
LNLIKYSNDYSNGMEFGLFGLNSDVLLCYLNHIIMFLLSAESSESFHVSLLLVIIVIQMEYGFRCCYLSSQKKWLCPPCYHAFDPYEYFLYMALHKSFHLSLFIHAVMIYIMHFLFKCGSFASFITVKMRE